MVFDVLEDTYLTSVEINAQNPGEITIDIGSLNGNIISQFVVNLDYGWNLVELNTLLVEGDNYTIGVTGNNKNLGLYRNDAVPQGVFPIQVADRLTIVGNTTDSPEAYFYYFYNWTIDASCSGTLSTSTAQSDNFLIYPNPVSDYLYFRKKDSFSSSNRINIINSQGQIVFSSELKENKPLSVSHLDNGVYFIEILNNDLVYRDKIYIN